MDQNRWFLTTGRLEESWRSATMMEQHGVKQKVFYVMIQKLDRSYQLTKNDYSKKITSKGGNLR